MQAVIRLTAVMAVLAGSGCRHDARHSYLNDSYPPTNPTVTPESSNIYFVARGQACPDCNGSGLQTCDHCHGVDLTKATCQYCGGVDQTTQSCEYCNGVDQTHLVCQYCNGVDQTTQSCSTCSGSGNWNGRRCFHCGGSGKSRPCIMCHGTGKRRTCIMCHGSGKRRVCTFCHGSGKQRPCAFCHGAFLVGGKCGSCGGQGSIETIERQFVTSSDLYQAVSADVESLNVRPFGWKDRPPLYWNGNKNLIAQDGSYYGEISDETGRPKTVFINGYLRKDGTYVASHYRSLPSPNSSPRGPPLRIGSTAPINTSYYGELNQYGIPKTVPVQGYYRKDGTYVQPHYRGLPRSRGGRR